MRKPRRPAQIGESTTFSTLMLRALPGRPCTRGRGIGPLVFLTPLVGLGNDDHVLSIGNHGIQGVLLYHASSFCFPVLPTVGHQPSHGAKLRHLKGMHGTPQTLGERLRKDDRVTSSFSFCIPRR